MNCRYTDEELKEDVERTIGIRAKDIEKIQFCGLWHIRFRAFGTDFYYYRSDSDDAVIVFNISSTLSPNCSASAFNSSS